DPYVVVRHARLVNTESDPKEAPSEAEELQVLGSRVPFIGKEFEAVELSGTRTDLSYSSASSDSTTLLSLDHPLTHISPTHTPTRASFHHRTTRMTVRVQPAMSPGHSARVTKVMVLSDSAFHTDSEVDELGDEDIEEDEEDESLDADDEGERSDDEGHGSDDEGCGLGDEDHRLDAEGRGLEGVELSLEEEEATPEGQQQVVLVMDTTVSKPLGLRYRAVRRRALKSIEEIASSAYEVGQSSRSMPEQQGADTVSVFRQPTLTKWADPEDDRVFTDW
ncbi:hypothetical protein Tco_0945199, partial [Tanacetum coccineum]